MSQLFQRSGPMARCFKPTILLNGYEIIPCFEGQFIVTTLELIASHSHDKQINHGNEIRKP